MEFDQQQIRLQELIFEAKKQGFVTHSQIQGYIIDEQDSLSFEEIVEKLEDATKTRGRGMEATYPLISWNEISSGRWLMPSASASGRGFQTGTPARYMFL